MEECDYLGFMTLFNPHTLALHHKRAQKTFREHAFLFDHVGGELTDRVKESQKPFKETLNISPHALPPFLCRAEPFLETSFDLVVSCLHAHWVNDLPAFLTTIHRCLQPGGLFLGALWGGNTLCELRESLIQAELSLKGGASPRVAPMLQPLDAPVLLGRAGFKNPVVDTETLTVTYPSLHSLMKDLRGMGETNKLADRVKTLTPSRLFEKASETYQELFGLSNGKIQATFEVIYLTGWREAQTRAPRS